TGGGDSGRPSHEPMACTRSDASAVLGIRHEAAGWTPVSYVLHLAIDGRTQFRLRDPGPRGLDSGLPPPATPSAPPAVAPVISAARDDGLSHRDGRDRALGGVRRDRLGDGGSERRCYGMACCAEPSRFAAGRRGGILVLGNDGLEW